MATQSDISDEQYQTEPDVRTFDIGQKTVESNVILDIRFKFLPLSATDFLNVFVRVRVLSLSIPMAMSYVMQPEHEHEHEREHKIIKSYIGH
jgi:hypothetical protein